MPALSIRSLCKSFLLGPAHIARRKQALSGVDFEVEEGEPAGIVGCERAGKTTLLLCAAGLLCCDSGAVYWYGTRLRAGVVPGIVYVPSLPTYYPFLTIREVLEYYPETATIPARRRQSLIDNFSARLGLSDQLSTPVSELNADVLKRVAIAQALVEEPRAILLDSTLEGLTCGAQAVHSVVADAAIAGVTIIASSRQASALAPVASRILVVDAGRITGAFTAERRVAARGFAELPPIRHIAERVH